MFYPSDSDYQMTKLIKQGINKLVYPFSDLCDWINRTFGVHAINSILDYMEHNNRPRLNIVLEYHEDEIPFMDKYQNYDAKKQLLIANEFERLVSSNRAEHGDDLANNIKAHDLLVSFCSFAPIAIYEANQNIPNDKIEELSMISKEIWTIEKNFRTIFYYTNHQLKANALNGINEKISIAYYSLIKQYDVFKYLDADNFSPFYDSKENFDEIYDGSWFYYSRDH